VDPSPPRERHPNPNEARPLAPDGREGQQVPLPVPCEGRSARRHYVVEPQPAQQNVADILHRTHARCARRGVRLDARAGGEVHSALAARRWHKLLQEKGRVNWHAGQDSEPQVPRDLSQVPALAPGGATGRAPAHGEPVGPWVGVRVEIK